MSAIGHHYENQRAMGPELTGRLHELAVAWGQYSNSYLATELDRSFFWSADHTGVIGFVSSGRHIKIVGGILAPSAQRAALLRDFIELARSRKGTLAFLSIGEHELHLFEAEHFQVTKWGEEAILDLPDRTWKGKQFERVRHLVSLGRRNGLVASEVKSGPPQDEETARLHSELFDVSAACLQGKAQARETSFIQAQLHPERADGRRIFVARAQAGTGRVDAFIVLAPGKGKMMWCSEIYRHRPDGLRNSLVFLFHEVANALKAEGAQQFTLGLVPAVRCGEPRPGDSAFTRHALQFSWNWLGFVFDLKGVYVFKDRFRPRYEPRYICTWPRKTLAIGSTIAFVRLWGALRLNPVRTAKAFVRQVFVVRGQRKKTLTTGREG